MLSNSLVLLSDDADLAAVVREAAREGEVYTANSLDSALELIRLRPPRLAIIDNDLKGLDGLAAFRQIQLFNTELKVLMVSSANDIPLAVSAAKIGVADFLKKPFSPPALKEAIERTAAKAGLAFIPAKEAWAKGEGLAGLYAEIQRGLSLSANILLFGETGIEKKEIAELIHQNSRQRLRQFKVIDLASFRRENLEAYFWTSVQELLAAPTATTLQDEDERCGTLYLENFDQLDSGFKMSIFEFFKSRKETLDKTILVIIGTTEKKEALSTLAQEYAQIVIPPLRERKGDLPFILAALIKRYSADHDKKLKGMEPALLEFLAAYDFPGNYRELEGLVEQGVLRSQGEILTLADLAVDFRIYKQVFFKKAKMNGLVSLDDVRRNFEAGLFDFLAHKNGENLGELAKYFDLPRTAIADRIEELSS